MYVPAHFAMPDDDVRAMLAAPIAGDLVTWSPEHGLDATVVPFVHQPDDDGWGSLHGHLARMNPQWQRSSSTAMAILRGPDGYVSPSWYATKLEHGRVVPTWDYVVVHVHGELVVHDDPEHLRSLVERLTDRHEAGRPAPWSVADAPDGLVDEQLRAIVGVELRIERVEAKAKLSQNRSPADVDGVVAGLHEVGEPALARAVEGARRS